MHFCNIDALFMQKISAKSNMSTAVVVPQLVGSTNRNIGLILIEMVLLSIHNTCLRNKKNNFLLCNLIWGPGAFKWEGA